MTTATTPRARVLRHLALATAAVCLVSWSAVTAEADPVTPTPGPTAAAQPDPTATPATTGSPLESVPSSPSVPSGSSGSRPEAQRADEPALTLAVASSGGPVAGQFWEDLGSFDLTGTGADLTDGTPVEVWSTTDGTHWVRLAATAVRDGRYAATAPVTAAGAYTLLATTGGAPGTGDAVSSEAVTVTVAPATVTLARPAARVDSLVAPPISGFLTPARAGVEVHLDAVKGKARTFGLVARATTDAAGRFRLPLPYGTGRLARFTIRATVHAENRDRWVKSPSQSFSRVAVLHAVVTQTTDDEVAKTYHKGCPVKATALRTVTMNFYGRDKRMHRGVLIVRADLTDDITRAFSSALKHRYPVARMDNPNVYGGKDPKQMAANNTSGFNCRKVVGNPLRQSPHSYGIAIDVNTVQNPYRDAHGKWWPANGKPYIKRKPLRWGMLNARSYLTRSLAKDHFFWGGRWNPGRDYQHFEYRKK